MSSEKAAALFVVDLMQPGDLPEILAIEASSFRTPWTGGMFQDELQAPHARCLVVRAQQAEKARIAAYIIFWLVADEVHLHNIAVCVDFRSQGLARNLMKLMRDIALAAGAGRQTLEVRESNTGAITLYHRCGFVVKGKRPRYYDDTREDALVMWAEVRQNGHHE
ncbi:MAG: ribosomal protein S18-alanine N-acetyltransferase [Smithellaceae bacterium]|nr:ribosomal protein S18-alanine N-acetyltransferase [Smithellaceae bacterium]